MGQHETFHDLINAEAAGVFLRHFSVGDGDGQASFGLLSDLLAELLEESTAVAARE